MENKEKICLMQLAIAKAEAFKIIAPKQYEKLLKELQPDIELIVKTHSKMIKETA